MLGIALLLLSFFFYAIHYFIFRDLHHIFLYLIGDIKRFCVLLVNEWLDYMKYLKDKCPYLFSLAVTDEPF